MAGSKMDAEEQEYILSQLDDGKTVPQVAYATGRDQSTINRLRVRYAPENKLAIRLLRANALKLAKRVIDRASVEEAIDVLSRPNIDVLKPITKTAEINNGVYISVQNTSLGAFKEPEALPSVIDVTPAPKPALPAAVEQPQIAAKGFKSRSKSPINLSYEVEGVTDVG